MARPPRPSAPDRESDAKRRHIDAIKLLPVLGVLLFLFPLLLGGSEGWSTAWVGLYLFAIWAGLIVAIGWLSHRLGGGGRDGPDEEER